MRVRGTRTRVTVTEADFSSSIRRGDARVEWYQLTRRRHASSFTVLGWSITVTATRGANGGRRARAAYDDFFSVSGTADDFGEAWERDNREALGYDQ